MSTSKFQKLYDFKKSVENGLIWDDYKNLMRNIKKNKIIIN